MKDLLRRHPSPAMVVAFVALLAALSGTAIALPGTNTVDSGDIKNNNVRSKDIRNNNVRGTDIRTGAVASGDVADDSLTGNDIAEASLGKVPSAANADNAANAATAANALALGGTDASAYAKNLQLGPFRGVAHGLRRPKDHRVRLSGRDGRDRCRSLHDSAVRRPPSTCSR